MLAALWPGLTGYLVPPAQTLRRWVRVRPHAPPPPLRVPAETDGSRGWVRLDEAGQARWAPAGGEAEDLPESVGVALLLFSDTSPQELAAVFQRLGVDLSRTGYARDGCSADGIVVTLGARGEAEPELPQVWFARKPLRPCRVVLPPAPSVRMAGRGPGGWPERLEMSDGPVMHLTGPPEADPGARPERALPLPDDWRRAF